MSERDMDRAIVKLMRKAMTDCMDAHDALLEAVDGDRGPQLALSYVCTAVSRICAVQAMYYPNILKLRSNELEELFDLFERFTGEFQEQCVLGLRHESTSSAYYLLHDAFHDSSYADI